MEQENTTPLIDFTKYTAERARNFSGREWVFQAINDWLTQRDGSRFFVLIGEPGSGKTAIASRLYQFSRGYIAPPTGLTHLATGFLDAVHFCSAHDYRWIDPHVFAESLAVQLAGRYPLYSRGLAERASRMQMQVGVEQRLEGASVSGQVIGTIIDQLNIGVASPLETFTRLVREPIEALYREGFGGQIVIHVDSLDEALSWDEKANIPDLLIRTEHLPGSVRFIVTSRPAIDVPRRIKAFKPEAQEIELTRGTGLAHSRDDVKQYARLALAFYPELKSKLASAFTPEAFAEAIRTKSEGNFLYINYLIEMLLERTKEINLRSLSELPTGLNNMYLEFLERLIGKEREGWQKQYAPILGTLAVAQEALSEKQLAEFVGVDQFQVRQTLTSLRQFLEVDESLPPTQRSYVLYHRSFADFLLSEDFAEEYWCQEREQHRRIVEYYRSQAVSWKAVDWEQVDDYGLLHLSAHLYSLREIETYRQHLYELVCEPLLRRKYARFGSHWPFIEDVQLATHVAGSEDPPNLVQEVRGHLIYATLSLLASAIPLELLAAMARAGQVDRALGFAELRQNKFYQGQAYWLIGLALLDSGEKEKAVEVFSTALMPEVVESCRYKSNLVSLIAVALARAGAVEKALAVTKRIGSSETETLNEIALACAQAGDRAMAVDIANQVLIAEKELDNWGKAKRLSDLTRTLAEAGEFVRAMTIAEEIEDPFHKVWGLCGIAFVLAHEGKVVGAKDLLDRAQMTVEPIENLRQKVEVRAAKAEVLTEIGEFESALATVEEIGDALYRVWSLIRIAIAFWRAGERTRALAVAERTRAIAETIQGEGAKISALSGMAEVFAEVGDRGETEGLIDQLVAMTSRDRPVDKYDRQVLWELVQSLIQARDRAGAIRIADHILEMARKATDAGQRAEAMSEVARYLAAMGEVERAVEVINQVLKSLGVMADEQGEVWALRGVAISLTRIREFDRAFEVAERIESEPLKMYGFSALAHELAQMGEMRRAAHAASRALLLTAPLGEMKLEEAVLKPLISALTRSGELEQALKLAEAMEGERSKALALGWIAYATIEAGERGRGLELADRCLALARAPDKEWDRDDVLIEVVRAFLQGGDFNRALTVTGMIGNEYWNNYKKVDTLSEIAQKLIEVGEHAKLVEVADQLFVLAESTEDEDKKLALLDQAAQMLCEAGEMESAVAVADQLLALAGIKDENQQLPSLGKVALILAELREKNRALAVANRVESIADQIKQVGQFMTTEMDRRNVKLKESALYSIAQALAEIGEGSRAVEVAKKMPTWPSMVITPKGVTLNKVALRLMQEGRFDLALELTEVIETPGWKDTTLRDLVQSMAQAGRFDESLSVVSKIDDEFYRRQAMMGLVYALDQAGHHERALELWRGELAKARLAGRAEAFNVLQAGASFITSHDNGVTLWKIYEAVMEVEDWWGK